MIRNTQESFDIKARGEKLQKELADLLRKAYPQHADSIRSTPMSTHGEDIQILTPEARQDIPFSFEAKFRKQGFGNTYTAYEQAARQEHAVSSALSNIPVAAIQQEGHDLLMVMHPEDWCKLAMAYVYVLQKEKDFKWTL